ncbi:extracellular solute-binding protein [Butyrivibrio sp. ob235]|uniref:sugar ABC transporter substrate-binding protein n=1 Tax=Butyrivibrio sp. ob235 TaxID=1761780 RepID=UPI0008BF3AC2|nr:extracellular solute-binding protein [Butyrivibrio sp. ob235]SEL45438.1 extracellular solute-binding protein [Butyrivibrio sp. ob235]
MKIRFRLLGAVLVIALLGAAFYYSRSGINLHEERSIFGANDKTTIRLWYTDDSMTDYLTGKAVEYNKKSKTTRAEIQLVSGLEYLEEISKASVQGDNYPDVFIMTHDSLEKAYLAGLAEEIKKPELLEDETLGFSDAAKNSITYKGKYIAYPYYFETSSLLYNRTYLEDEVRARRQAELDAAEGELAQAAADAGEIEGEDITEAEDAPVPEISEDAENADGAEYVEESAISAEEVEAGVNEMLPSTIEDILLFADNYNAPDTVESVFRWDVTDIFYNYFFVGNYLNLGGQSGDDTSQINVYNEDTINCMSFYQQLNQFFAIDESVVTYENVLQDFIDGKTVFTVATTDAVAKIEEAKAAGNCSFEYGVTTMPALNDTYGTRTMSVTECLVVNGYSEHQEKANDFAAFLCSENTDTCYTMSGKLIAHEGIPYGNDSLDSFVSVYAKSVPMPKLMATSNFWVQLEIAFSNIWEGANVNDTLKTLSENVKLQIGGTEVTEERLPDASIVITEGQEE